MKLLIAALLLSTACAQEREAESVHPLAAGVLEALFASDLESVASMLHYPESYTPEEVIAERKKIVSLLQTVEQRFGRVLEAEVSRRSTPFFEVGVYAGTNEYWSSYERLGLVRAITYDVMFSTAGAGVVKVSLFSSRPGWKVHSVSYGLWADSPEAEETIGEVARSLADRL